LLGVAAGVLISALAVIGAMHGHRGGKRFVKWVVVKLVDFDRHGWAWHWYARQHGWALRRNGGVMGTWGFIHMRQASSSMRISPASRIEPYRLTHDPH